VRNQIFSTFWHGGRLPPLSRACLRSFVERGHRVRVFGYEKIDVPDGVILEDARVVLPEEDLFSYHNSFSAFSNIFRYRLLLQQGGWWIDTDVYCLEEDIPESRYSWAKESKDFVNGAILRFPAGDATLAAILTRAERIGSNVEIQGQLGPRLLTEVLAGQDFVGHFGSTKAFYPVHWLEAHRFWTPGDRDFIRAKSSGSCFIHFWTMMFRYLGIDENIAPPRGSFLHEIFAQAKCLDGLLPLTEECKQRTLSSIRSFLSADSRPELSQHLLGYDVSRFRERDEVEAQPSVAVVVPTYNMAWCVERAIASCLVQTLTPTEIIVVDDGSVDLTSEIVGRIAGRDERVRYLPIAKTGGHLPALRRGLRSCSSEWAVLLDADDELTPDSIERRLEAAERYHETSGEWPQLVYGDLYRNSMDASSITRFKSLQGRVFPFLSRELSLCQTSTIMLGREAINRFPDVTNPYNTDDEIVVAVGRDFPVIHAGAPVAVAYDHASPTRMTNNVRRRLRGITQLVRNHRTEIVREHGWGRLVLWQLRVLRVVIEWQREWAEGAAGARGGDERHWALRWLAQRYSRVAGLAYVRLTSYLRARFEQIYF